VNAGAAVLAVALGAALVGGCGDDRNSAGDGERLTSTELGWIRALSAWSIDISDDEGEHPFGAAAVESCRGGLESDVGEPPSDRLRPAADAATAACPLLAEQGTRRRALDRIDDADDVVLALFLDRRDLELSDAPSETSRTDTRLSAVASEGAERPVEVRCWDDDDWRTVIYEDNAWNDDSGDPDDLVGWSDLDWDHVHMRIADCNRLSRVAGGGALPGDHEERVATADGLETLAHEIQHFVEPDADEADIECAALEAMPRLARALRIDSGVSSELRRLYVDEVYPDLDDEYRVEGGCTQAQPPM